MGITATDFYRPDSLCHATNSVKTLKECVYIIQSCGHICCAKSTALCNCFSVLRSAGRVHWTVLSLYSGLPAICVGLYCLIVYIVYHYVVTSEAVSIYGDVTGTRDM